MIAKHLLSELKLRPPSCYFSLLFLAAASRPCFSLLFLAALAKLTALQVSSRLSVREWRNWQTRKT